MRIYIRPVFTIFVFSCLFSALASAETITIVHLNDTHAHLMPFGPKDVEGVGTIGGFARVATILDSLKNNEPNPMLLHAGDVFVGDFMFNKFFGVPDLSMMKLIGFDAMTLGNHEFDLLPLTLITVLEEVIDRYDTIFPLLSANVDLSDPSLARLDELVSDYITKTFGSTRVGVFGLTTTETNDISFPDPAVITDPVAAAAEVVPVLRGATEDCDVVVLLSHLGLRTEKMVAESVPGIDIIIGGHSHDLTPEPVEVVNTTSGKTTWIVQAGEHGSHVGKLTFDYTEDSGVTVSEFNLIPVDDSVEPNAIVDIQIGWLVDSLRVDSHYGAVYDNVVAEASIDIEKDPGQGHEKDTPLGNLVTDAYRQKTGTDIALTATGFLAQKIWAGAVTPADIFQVVPYGYDPVSGLGFKLTTFDIKGSELLKGIEFSVSRAEVDQSYLLQVSGMTFRYDSTRESWDRVHEVLIGGEPLDAEAVYSVTVAPFHPVFLTSVVGVDIPEYEDTEFLEFNVVRDYFAALSPIDSTDARVEGRVMDTLAPDLDPPANPTGLVAGRADGKIILTWSANTESDLWYYNMYRNTTGAFTLADSVFMILPPDTTFTDSGLVDGTLYYYAVTAVDSSLNMSDFSGTVQVTFATGIDSEPILPVKFYISQNYPNPFNPETTIRFGLPETAFVSLRIYNINGQLVRTLKNGPMPPGNHVVRWDGKGDNGRDSGSGVYFYRIQAGRLSRTRRMVLLK